MKNFYSDMVDFFKNNYDWVFSGIGVFIISSLLLILFRKKNIDSNKTIDKSPNSFQADNISAARDVHLHISNSPSEKECIDEMKNRPIIEERRNHNNLKDIQKNIIDILSNSPMSHEQLTLELGITEKMLDNLMPPLIRERRIEVLKNGIVKIVENSK